MKTIISLFTIMIIVNLYAAGGPAVTTANLKEAYKGESTASAKYAAYALQAKKDGFQQIAILFDAASKAESIHATNHKMVLVKMGEKIDVFTPDFTVKTTKENLEDAIRGESYEASQMYPQFVSTSRKESLAPASKSFAWAMDTEKKHLLMYTQALDALNAGKIQSLPVAYYVCPKCGNTYDKKPQGSCSFCATPSSKFMKFGK